MSKFDRHMSAAAAAVIGLALVGLAAANGQAGGTAGPVQCGIEAKTVNGMTGIAGVVLATTAVEGDYSFAVASSGPGGRSNISQGGRFAAGANEAVAVGRATINANASYDVVFEVRANGVKLDCAAPVSLG